MLHNVACAPEPWVIFAEYWANFQYYADTDTFKHEG